MGRRTALRWSLGLTAALLLGAAAAAGRAVLAGGGEREAKVRKDRERVEAQKFWIYNDLARGLAEAKQSGRPLVVALRCVPCEECVKLDDELVDTDPRLRPLLEQFVRVRLVSTNGLDLATFQFDTDQSFAVFLLRADATVYGRFGTRSHRTEWADDVSIEGLAAALEGALALHRAWPKDQAALTGKRGAPPAWPTPERYPTLKDRYRSTLATEGDVVPSCVHCHQIGEAQQAEHLARGELPEEALFPYPNPKALGLVLDPKQRATVKAVEPGSPAAAAGFLPGDRVLTLAGQPPLSIADVQWVLHHVPARGGRLEAEVERGEQRVHLTWDLAAGWRRLDDIGWRASTWQLRRAALGGVILQPLGADDPVRKDLPEANREAARLRVGHVGQYAPHDRAKRAGMRKGDVLLSFDGRADFAREADLIAYALDPLRRGRAFALVVQRGAETLTLRLMPE